MRKKHFGVKFGPHVLCQLGRDTWDTGAVQQITCFSIDRLFWKLEGQGHGRLLENLSLLAPRPRFFLFLRGRVLSPLISKLRTRARRRSWRPCLGAWWRPSRRETQGAMFFFFVLLSCWCLFHIILLVVICWLLCVSCYSLVAILDCYFVSFVVFKGSPRKIMSNINQPPSFSIGRHVPG